MILVVREKRKRGYEGEEGDEGDCCSTGDGAGMEADGKESLSVRRAIGVGDDKA